MRFVVISIGLDPSIVYVNVHGAIPVNCNSIPGGSSLQFTNSAVLMVAVGGCVLTVTSVLPVKHVPTALLPSVNAVIKYKPSSETGNT